VLSQDFFKGLDVEAVRGILDKFTEIQEINKAEMRGGKRGKE
jgi:hypothetical protein